MRIVPPAWPLNMFPPVKIGENDLVMTRYDMVMTRSYLVNDQV